MPFTLVGKVVTGVVALGVIAGLTTVIVLTVNESNGKESTTESPTTTTPSSTTPTSTTEGSDLPYRVGVGIADMTGPCVEITFMGYAEVGQRGQGIHTRQFARSFIFAEGDSRVVLVTAEVQAVGIAVRREVVKNLQERYGDMYNLRNVILTGTHTHSTPGGHMVDFILDISILGFSRETFSAYVDGITRSIIRAHENMVPARLFFGQTTVTGAQMNRSPFSYGENPKEERARYEDLGNQTDITLTQVKIVREDGRLHGVMNWYAVHTTSMNMTNQLVSSDNLGYAALRMEKELNPWSKPGKPEIVAGFFSSNLGDVSPNTQGARCEFSGKECDNQFLICQHMERCFAQGPGRDMMESTKIIGTAVFEGALEVLNTPEEELEELTGSISVRHQFMKMDEQRVPKYNTLQETFDEENMVTGCVPALGYSFASGTVDGANTMNITQGTLEPMPILGFVASLIGAATDEDKECHHPKPILLATGRANFPIPWHPHIISASVVWLGSFAILGVPGEPTTMAGRRMRAAVGKLMASKGIEPKVVVSGLTNEYIHYITTLEEYQVQRYEAASTLYGPHTLDVFINKFVELTTAIIEDTEVDEGPSPPDHRNRLLSLITPVVLDSTPLSRNFGDCVIQPPARVKRGDVVSATFVGANPRNDLKHEESHAVVERLELSEWVEFATDADWDTVFRWERMSVIRGTSQATFEWRVPEDAVLTRYRIVYYGAARAIRGALTPFRGVSNEFQLY
ncbi:neutral ceramidase-like [Spodoptera frugiperda]|uniref:Neutral ceramidase n=1 Tax=Spodoptera frugiperda TaxID=7108 RepID=A0A9R0EAK5_SPOFR|nr:neutral ceramidase-like [Spodoptera frugiperda]